MRSCLPSVIVKTLLKSCVPVNEKQSLKVEGVFTVLDSTEGE